jgi:hypothetical protein
MMAMMQLLTHFVSLFVIGFLAGYGTPAMVSNQKANSPVALMARLLKVELSWPSQRKSPSRRGYYWALYVGYLTSMGAATLGWIWFLVWCVWQLA